MNVADERKDRWMIAAVLLVAVECLAGMGWVSRLVPVAYKDPSGQPQPIPPGLEPERELPLYLLTCAIALTIGFVMLVRRPRLPGTFSRTLPAFTITQAIFVAAELALAFKLITYHHPFYPVLTFENPDWIMSSVCAVFLLSALCKIFWPECVAVIGRAAPRVSAWSPPRWTGAAANAAVVVVLVLLLWIPDSRIPLALGFWFDRLTGVDQKAGWAVALGWDYPLAIRLLFAAAIAKAAVFFGLLRWWGRPFWLCVAGLLWFIRWEYFYYDPNPTGWLSGREVPAQLLLAGFENGPMFAPLRVRQFWAFDMSFAIPVLYMAVLLFMVTRQWKKSKDRDGFIVIGLALAGLMLFAEAIIHPSVGRYAACAWPLIAIAVWGADQALRHMFRKGSRWAGPALAVLLLLALLTNRMFLVYPNLFHGGDHRYGRIVASWMKAWDVSKQAEFIRSRVPDGKPVAIISSFECRLLQQAGRRSLWPTVPLLHSQFPSENMLPVLAVWRKDQLARVLEAAQAHQPPFMFVEAKLWQYFKENPDTGTGLGALMGYLITHYEPVAQEDFLVAVKRKD